MLTLYFADNKKDQPFQAGPSSTELLLFIFPSHDENCDCGYCHDSKTDSRVHSCMVHKSCLCSNCVGCIITAVSGSRCRGCAWSRCLTWRRILCDGYACICSYLICIICGCNGCISNHLSCKTGVRYDCLVSDL